MAGHRLRVGVLRRRQPPLRARPSPASSFPSLAELAYLAVYPLIAVHLLALVHVRVPRFRPTTWLDGAVGALGVTAVVTTFVLTPWLDMAGLEANAATLTYPVTDVLLLALVAAVIADPRAAQRPHHAAALVGLRLQADR